MISPDTFAGVNLYYIIFCGFVKRLFGKNSRLSVILKQSRRKIRIKRFATGLLLSFLIQISIIHIHHVKRFNQSFALFLVEMLVYIKDKLGAESVPF